ncbi:HAMP domain-containing histidine kinase [Psychrobacillus sp. INOP01]|uniref:HAMP domain-containing sensor histidine kinase n=1 Tax=Psychrobacillus sp. INOP01 TaxID=2829187 RepID=UPI001BA6BB12|nr:HAMP domain-containing sensor histidine kinase [Psychrobacillus sp. INOP01]QUG40396.1 HAMP domain-containing histidine kinase [Psychrobacillus sp. INOP01]
MFVKNKRITLLSYWTSRYVLTLCIGLILISFISALWIRHTTLENRLGMMEFMADEMVYRITNEDAPDFFPNDKMNDVVKTREPFGIRDIDPIMYVVRATGEVISSNRPYEQSRTFSELIDGEEGVVTFHSESKKIEYYLVKRKIEVDGELLGWVLMVESKDNLIKVDQEYGQLAILILGLAILGWIAIYFLSKRLARPIKQVAKAAKQVQDGNYEIDLPDYIKEKEVYELVSSFKEMASRLEQLEATRTELLAGVTHELKTPVTSISGLLQAVKDGVVSEQDADEFISMALVETTKMKTMVGDLLAFNSFAVNAVPINLTSINIDQFIREVSAQWEAIQEHENVKLYIHLLQKETTISADIVRAQQILTNLLTNAQQAIQGVGNITISLSETDHFVSIQVQDTGRGITEEDRPYIFERFFRGENKKYETRGLGLGLPLSKMMAQSMGGDLSLISSGEKGTCFELQLKKAVNDLR